MNTEKLEEQISQKISEIESELSVQEETLYSLRYYRQLIEAIPKLEANIETLQNSSFDFKNHGDDGAELYETPAWFDNNKIVKKSFKVTGGSSMKTEIVGDMEILPSTGVDNYRDVIYDITVAEEFKNFMINIRQRLLDRLLDKKLEIETQLGISDEEEPTEPEPSEPEPTIEPNSNEPDPTSEPEEQENTEPSNTEPENPESEPEEPETPNPEPDNGELNGE
jgi:hypothetical protein